MLTVGMYNKGNVAIGKACTDNEYRMQFSLWCLAGSPLIIGANILELNPAMKELLLNKRLIAIDQDPECRPPYLVSQRSVKFRKKTEKTPLSRSAALKISFTFSLRFFLTIHLLLLITICLSRNEMLFSFADAGIPYASGYGFTMEDAFTGESIGVVRDYQRVTVPGHDCKLYICKLVDCNA